MRRSQRQLSTSSFASVALGRSHKEAWAGCIVSLTTPTRSSLSVSRSVSLRSWAEKASRVFLASYFLRSVCLPLLSQPYSTAPPSPNRYEAERLTAP
jgi:hypothetical protein